jgi:hypothetical protein
MEVNMKNCKNVRYYVAAMGKKYYFGQATGDMLTARITLDRARRTMPDETWGIVAYAM